MDPKPFTRPEDQKIGLNRNGAGFHLGRMIWA
jgi:hypothetical protein